MQDFFHQQYHVVAGMLKYQQVRPYFVVFSSLIPWAWWILLLPWGHTFAETNMLRLSCSARRSKTCSLQKWCENNSPMADAWQKATKSATKRSGKNPVGTLSSSRIRRAYLAPFQPYNRNNNYSWWLNLRPNRQTWNNVVQNCGIIHHHFPFNGSGVTKLPTNKSLKPLH